MMRKTLGFATGIAFCAVLAVGVAAGQKGGGKGDAKKGADVFAQCSPCHNVDSPDFKGGPSLQGLFKKKTLPSGKPANDANVMNQINNGGGQMPAYGDQLSADDKANLLAYLHTV